MTAKEELYHHTGHLLSVYQEKIDTIFKLRAEALQFCEQDPKLMHYVRDYHRIILHIEHSLREQWKSIQKLNMGLPWKEFYDEFGTCYDEMHHLMLEEEGKLRYITERMGELYCATKGNAVPEVLE